GVGQLGGACPAQGRCWTHPVQQGQEPERGLVVSLFQDASEQKMVQVRLLLHGSQTVLGDVASDSELFVTEEVVVRPLAEVAGLCHAQLLQRPWVWAQRQQHFRDDEALRKANDERREAGQPLHYIYRSYYQPSQGMFCALPPGLLDVSKGAYVEDPSKPISLGLLPGGAGFIKAGVEYRIGDVMYLHPQTFDDDLVPRKAIKKEGGPKASKAKKGRAQRKAGVTPAASGGVTDPMDPAFDSGEASVPDYVKGKSSKGGSNLHLRPFAVAQLVECHSARPGAAALALQLPARLTLRRLYRPEEVSKAASYRAGWWDL
ncbi:cytosine-specific methyltransferase, partial [Haematococcus lacustris]